MQLDSPTFRKIEAVGWTVFICTLFLFFGNFFTFIWICLLIRYVFMTFKRKKLPAVDPAGKWVLITGCDSGFGLGLARRLYELGFQVFATCLYPDKDGGAELKNLASSSLSGDASTPGNCGRIVVLPLDVTDDVSVARCLDAVKRECSNIGLWGLVNNAGCNFVGDVELTTVEQYMMQGNINLYGSVRTCKAFLPLIRQTKGRIVNVTSVKGLCVSPSCAAYCITKFGLEAFSDSLRIEMEQFGINISVIEPCNFGGVTGCLNEPALKRIKSQLDEQWAEASDEVKQLYGEEHLPRQLEEARKSATTTAPTIEPVLQAFEDALCSPCPKVRYLVKGSNSYFDFYYILGLLCPYVPQRLLDKMRAYFLPYHIYK
ncbi:D-beta-hydroxybutyrate dehydrogenase, mitochondrial [Plakobranchus ocellatus]|uniref:D-beta-hydroxybutyrate dehydrogenase, mitochondrial n=1 Tax=Plakobranchus ocellatus TaxID=259542 RepID=A0AAV4A6P7_9GAST|nr:D-beta-hydroxybutyrate dehydrogenase, mitochondrial [Plakobranchus ocellatus]